MKAGAGGGRDVRCALRAFFLRQAPTHARTRSPGVQRASRSASTPPASGLPLRYRSRIWRLPLTSGSGTATCARRRTVRRKGVQDLGAAAAGPRCARECACVHAYWAVFIWDGQPKDALSVHCFQPREQGWSSSALAIDRATEDTPKDAAPSHPPAGRSAPGASAPGPACLGDWWRPPPPRHCCPQTHPSRSAAG